MTYERQIDTALRLIAKFGGPAKLFVTTVAGGVNDWNTDGAATEQSTGPDFRAAFFGYNQHLIDGDVIRAGDQKVLIAAKGLPLVPNLNGRLERGTEKWSIVNIKPLNVNGEPIIYTLQVRQ